jgi:ATP synthase protein I
MRPFRIVLLWQVIATAVLAIVAAFPWGWHGALSAALGGAVNVAAGVVYAWMASRSKASTAGQALRAMLRAEALKVTLIVAGLGLVLTNYRNMVHVAFFASFVITVGVFAAAIAVRDTEDKNASGGWPPKMD